MAEQKAAVEVKQEREFTLKGKNVPKRKVKDLGKTSKEPVKMEMKKPVEEKVEAPKIDLTKKEDNAVQERKTEEIPVGDKPETSREVDKEVRVSDTNDKKDSPLNIIQLSFMAVSTSALSSAMCWRTGSCFRSSRRFN